MTRRWLRLVLLLVPALLAAAETRPVVRLNTLEWPPYTTEALPDRGHTTAVVEKVWQAAGFDPKIRFRPWSRTVREARTGQNQIEGYFPEYYAEALTANFLFSDPIGGGWLGLAEQTERPIRWQRLQDLKPYTIGVVTDYVNTRDFDAAVRDGWLRTDEASDDQKNLRKLLYGRLDLVVIDENVFAYLLSHDASLLPGRTLLQINPQKLEYKKLYLCLRKSAEAERKMASFNLMLRQLQDRGEIPLFE
ncbi:ABC transporter substrate-binding protein [Permianibacter aggregans]|uniref:Amino acid ABC transporter substrate-binding protein (PAAT family) n=1 Tax=Permianibacter aggregans TaxID=1510150 RepID=A0A4R6UWP0_9GAMM|nr:ABC transporter substrate-binding protein [Permianibacter aggregans]TDQ50686.1 amino acid ABC transporter substrate-binding protein (PAAT family) [Permianibacter aggregans]